MVVCGPPMLPVAAQTALTVHTYVNGLCLPPPLYPLPPPAIASPPVPDTCTTTTTNFVSVLTGPCPPPPPPSLMLPAVEMIPMASVPPNVGTPPLPPLPSWNQSYGMDQVWQNNFKMFFQQYAPHQWVLIQVQQKPDGLWNVVVDSAKVRFCCEGCGHGWTSMKGRVAFWFVLNPRSGSGIVSLKLYGQQCDRCKSGNYEPAMWYPEEVVKVLANIYNKVGQLYYGFHLVPYHKTRRPGKPRTPHNNGLCQACKDGVCAERR